MVASPAIVANADETASPAAESSQTQSAQPENTNAAGSSQTPSTSTPVAPNNSGNKQSAQIPATSGLASTSKETTTPASGDAAKTDTASKETTDKTQPQGKDAKNTKQQASQPAAQGNDTTVSCGTLKGCFPDPSFRAYLVKFINTEQYPNPKQQTGWFLTGNQTKSFDEFPVTQAWLDSVTSISSDGIPQTGSADLPVSIKSIEGINLFQNLKSFNMEYDTSTAHEIAVSSPGFYGVESLDPITLNNMPNLETLKLQNFTAAIADSCKNLKDSTAPKLTNIYTYDVDHAFSDASMFYGLHNVKTLSLSNTDVGRNGDSDIQAIVDHFPGLESLSFSNAYNLKSHPDSVLILNKLEHLKSFGFTALFLYQNPILNRIAQLSKINTLDLSSNSIYNVEFLSKMSNLEALDISDNQITDLRPLADESLSNLNKVIATQEIPRIAEVSVIGADGSASFSYGNNYNIDGSVPHLKSVNYIRGGVAMSPLPTDLYHNDTTSHIFTVSKIDSSSSQVSYTLGDNIVTKSGKNLGSLEIINNQDFHNPQATFDLRGGSTPNGSSHTTRPRTTPYGQKPAQMWNPVMFNDDGSKNPNITFEGWVGCATQRSVNLNYLGEGSGEPYTNECTFEKAEPIDYSNTVMTKDLTLFALWSTDSYDVTFDTGLKDGPVVNKQHVLRFQHATDPGKLVYTDALGESHDLIGWFAPDGTKYDFGTQVTGPVTLSAKWKGITTIRTVTFDANGGKFADGKATQTVKVKDNETVTKPANPTKDGYKFDGWFENGSETAFDFTKPIIKNVSLQAKWTEIHTVTFDANGGKLADGTNKKTVKVEDGQTTTKPADPTKSGYAFDGWFEQGADTAFDFDTPITADVSLQAKWTATYKVTFAPNGGKLADGTVDQTVKEGDTAKQPADPTWTHHKFAGWFENGSAFDFTTPITKDVTLQAHWTEITHTVTFDPNGGKLADAATQTVNDGDKATKPADPTNDCYTFAGWYENGSKTAFDFTKPITKDVNLQAHWTASDCTVTFDANGGKFTDGTNKKTVKVNKGQTTTPLADPTRDGYAFDGWYEQGANTAFDFTKPITNSTTLQAKWTVTHTVTFDANGGKLADGTVDQTVKEGDKATKPADPTNDCYTFAGWFENGSKTAFDFTKPITKDVNLQAHWTASDCTVTFDANGGKLADGTNKKTVKVNKGQTTTPLADPTRDGYAFDGWYEQGANTAFDFTKPITNSTTLQAHWTVTYTVTFDANGGKLADGTVDQTVKEGDKATEPEAPTRTGYTFAGWYKKGATSAFDFTKPITANVNLIAQWKAIPYTVHFDANGGKLADGTVDQTVDYGSKVTNPGDPTRDGYTFAGWTTDQEGTQPFNLNTDTVKGKTTLYAQWKLSSEYTVKFEANGGTFSGGTTEEIMTVKSGEKVTAPKDLTPKSEHYTFKRWTLKQDGGRAYDFDSPVTSDLILYAQWSHHGDHGNGGNSGTSGSNGANGNGGNGSNGANGNNSGANNGNTSNRRRSSRHYAWRHRSSHANGVNPNATAPVPDSTSQDQVVTPKDKQKKPAKKHKVPVCPSGYVLRQSADFEDAAGNVEMAKINPKCVQASTVSQETTQHSSFMWLWWLLLLFVLVIVAMYTYHRYERNKAEKEQPIGSQHIAY
ncbi:InlB B-repeat-containing protein [Bifidobacterium sp. ESL0704]|uniref:InlB B-repeat-containing protein n=1 Tax=Bifidobacterium sp. ESL0704 TaxID=2983219 RepID=UPI0023F74638|nr:InlB B-repeat-containing protein [Bifidobacterium sp. ESL0704]WEV53007.1 InlB B-repeat-containing protein [Bifidobacterium sp. ESL0704]